MNLEVNDLKFDVCVPVHRVFGEPKAGRRFKGKSGCKGGLIFSCLWAILQVIYLQ